jgi:hypothetical protein
MSLPSPDAPIGEPRFAMMEILVILTMPAMVGLMVAAHAWASPGKKVFGVMAVVFMGLVPVVTCSVHFVILAVSHRDEFAGQSWTPSVLSFRWLHHLRPRCPRLGRVLRVGLLSAAAVFAGSHLESWIRLLMIISGVLAFAGLSGVILDDARARNIGIAGYAVVFPVAALLLTILFRRAHPRDTSMAGPGTIRPGTHGQQPVRGAPS